MEFFLVDGFVVWFWINGPSSTFWMDPCMVPDGWTIIFHMDGSQVYFLEDGCSSTTSLTGDVLTSSVYTSLMTSLQVPMKLDLTLSEL